MGLQHSCSALHTHRCVFTVYLCGAAERGPAHYTVSHCWYRHRNQGRKEAERWGGVRGGMRGRGGGHVSSSRWANFSWNVAAASNEGTLHRFALCVFVSHGQLRAHRGNWWPLRMKNKSAGCLPPTPPPPPPIPGFVPLYGGPTQRKHIKDFPSTWSQLQPDFSQQTSL